MPSVYDNQTNLNAQGRFAPSVNYYATVRSPNVTPPKLDKAEASFNIDLRSLGDAVTSIAEMKLKSEQAKEDREYDKYKFEQGLELDKEKLAQARELADLDRDFKYKQLAVQMRGQDFDKDYKDKYLDYLNSKLSEDKSTAARASKTNEISNWMVERLKQSYIDYRNGNADARQMRTDYMKARDEGMAKYGYDSWNDKEIQTYLSSTYGDTFSLANTIEDTAAKNRAEEERKLQDQAFQDFYKSNPWVQSKGLVGAKEFFNNMQTYTDNIAKDASILGSPYSDLAERKAAYDRLTNNGQNVVISQMAQEFYKAVYAPTPEMQRLLNESPKSLEIMLKNKYTNTLVQLGLSAEAADMIVEQSANKIGLSKALEDKSLWAKESSEYAKNMIDIKTKSQQSMMLDNDTVRYIASLPQNVQQLYMKALEADPDSAKALAKSLVYIQAAGKDDDSLYVSVHGEATRLDADQVAVIRNMFPTAESNEEAIYQMLFTRGTSALRNFGTGALPVNEAATAIEQGLGAANKDGGIASAKNVDTMVNTAGKTIEQLQTMCDKGEIDGVRCSGILANAKLNKLIGDEQHKKLLTAVDRLAPNVQLDYIKTNRIDIVKTADGIMLDRINLNSLAGNLGDKAWAENAAEVSNMLAKSGLSVDEQAQFLVSALGTLKKSVPDLQFAVVPSRSKTLFSKAVRDAYGAPWGFVEAAGKAETTLASELSKAAQDESKENTVNAREESMNNLNIPIKTQQSLSEIKIGSSDYFVNGLLIEDVLDTEDPMEAFMGKFNMIERPSISAFNRTEVQNKDNTHSTIEAIIREFDGTYYVLPTVWDGKKHSVKEADDRFLDTFEHLGGFKTKEDAEEYYVNNVHKLLK